MKPVSSFAVAMTFVGSMVGMGFASGQELLQFFGGFGHFGPVGILVSAIFYAVYGALILVLARRMGTDSYNRLIVPGGNPVLMGLVDLFMAVLLFGTFSIMAAGASSLLQEQFHLPALAGGVLLVVMALLTVYKGSDSLLASFRVVVPLMIAAALAVSLTAIGKASVVAFADPTDILRPNPMVGNWFFSALLFVLYSTPGAVGTLSALSLKLKDDKSALRAAALGAGVLGLFAAVVYVAVLSYAGDVAVAPMPMLALAKLLHPAVGVVYVLVLFTATYTAAVGALFGLKARVSHLDRLSDKKKDLLIVAVAVVALLGTQVGFVKLVSVLYPLYGYAGILIFIGMLANFRLTRRKK